MLKYSANPDKYGSHERILAMLQDLPAGSSVRDYYVVDVEQDNDAASVAADILEHLRLSLNVLSHLRDLLSSTGRFVISVPDVANIYVRLNLFLGRFDYAERDILNETYLRLFTLNSACALVQKAALRVKQIVVTPIPLPLLFPGTREGASWHFLHRANWAITQTWKRLFAYPLILVAVHAR